MPSAISSTRVSGIASITVTPAVLLLLVLLVPFVVVLLVVGLVVVGLVMSLLMPSRRSTSR